MSNDFRVLVISLTLLSLAGVSCSSSGKVGTSPGVGLAHEVELDGPEGADALKLEPKENKIELEDGTGQEIATFRWKGDRFSLRNAQGQSVGTLRFSPPDTLQLVVDDRVHLELEREPDGDLRLVNEADRLLYEIKKRDYGAKVEDATGNEIAKVRVKNGKTSIKNADGTTALSTRDPLPPAAAACFGLTQLTREHQAVLCVGVVQWHLAPQP